MSAPSSVGEVRRPPGRSRERGKQCPARYRGFNVFGGTNISPVAPMRHVVARASPVLDQPLAADLSEIAAAPALRSTHHERHDRGDCHAGEADHNDSVHEAIRWRRTFVMSTFLWQKPAARRNVARKSGCAADWAG